MEQPTKSRVIGVILLIVVLGVVVGLWFRGNKDNPTPPSDKLITKVATLLNEEQVVATQEKIDKLNEQITKRDLGGEPDLLPRYIALGQQYELLGELGKARDAYVSATNESNKAAMPWINLGSLYQRMGSITLALQSYTRATSLEPTLVPGWEAMIMFARSELHYGEAETKALYGRALTATSNDPRLYKAYADYLASVGSRLDAIMLYENLVKAFPDDKTLRSVLEQLRSGK